MYSRYVEAQEKDEPTARCLTKGGKNIGKSEEK